MNSDMQASAMPNMQAKFGIVFAIPSDSTQFAHAQRASWYVYMLLEVASAAALRLEPPKDADTRAKYLHSSRVNGSIDMGESQGKVNIQSNGVEVQNLPCADSASDITHPA